MRSAVYLAIVVIAIATVSCGGGGNPSQTSGPSPSPSPASASPTQPPSESGWTSLAPLPTPRSEVAVAEVNGLIYVVGGFEGNGAPSQKVEVYDPATDTWSEAPPLPRPRHHTAAAEWGACKQPCPSDLLVIGGYETGFADAQTTVYRYDPNTRTWSNNPPLTVARGGHSAAIVNGNPVVVGGAGADGQSLTSAEWLDGMSEEWHLFGGEMAVARDHLAAATVSIASGHQALDHLFAIGGRRNIDFGRNLEVNEASNSFGQWQAAAPMPTARSGIAAAALDGRIYVFGGEGPNGTFDETAVYDPTTDTWTTAAPMPIALHGLGAAVVDGVIYVIGGGPTPGLSVSNANNAFRP